MDDQTLEYMRKRVEAADKKWAEVATIEEEVDAAQNGKLRLHRAHQYGTTGVFMTAVVRQAFLDDAAVRIKQLEAEIAEI